MPKHFQTLTLQHSFIRFIAPTPDNPKSLFVGWEGGVLRMPVRLPVVDWELTFMTDKQNGGGRQLERVRANHRFSLR